MPQEVQAQAHAGRSETAASAKVAIPACSAQAWQQRHRQRRAAALAQAQAEVEQRLRRQGFEHMPMARLGTTVGEQQPVAAGRVQAHRAERRDAADVAVDQGDHAFLRAGQVGAGQRGDLQPTETAEGFEGVGAMGAGQSPALGVTVHAIGKSRSVDRINKALAFIAEREGGAS